MEISSASLPPGFSFETRKNFYTIKGVLGTGGFGITYLAGCRPVGVPHDELEILVAIKEHFIGKYSSRNPEDYRVVYPKSAESVVNSSLREFLAETRRLSMINGGHRHIVSILEVFTANNTAYYSMDYLGKESLESYVLRNGPLSEHRMWEIMEPVINAVGYLHSHRVTHLDIKPQNIMLSAGIDGKQQGVLIDFGLSKHYDEQDNPTSTMRSVGVSHGFAPLEQYAGISSFSPKADVYALGATAFFCLTGKIPPSAPDRSPSDVAKMLEVRVPPLSVSTKNAVADAMELQPEARTDTPREILHPSDQVAVWMKHFRRVAPVDSSAYFAARRAAADADDHDDDDDDEDDAPVKDPRATAFSRIFAILMLLLLIAGWLYTRFT